LIAGHWLPNRDGSGGPADAAGQPSVISAEADSGARAVLFGTYPTFRTHPRGMWADVATALFWAGSEGEAPGPGNGKGEGQGNGNGHSKGDRKEDKNGNANGKGNGNGKGPRGR
ncbi:hypothetical protein PU560_03355, partial [Georgenia sp. 10Sc9-8]|nr:hypothetical protein [Georgenia halotolerans]